MSTTLSECATRAPTHSQLPTSQSLIVVSFEADARSGRPAFVGFSTTVSAKTASVCPSSDATRTSCRSRVQGCVSCQRTRSGGKKGERKACTHLR